MQKNFLIKLWLMCFVVPLYGYQVKKLVGKKEIDQVKPFIHSIWQKTYKGYPYFDNWSIEEVEQYLDILAKHKNTAFYIALDDEDNEAGLLLATDFKFYIDSDIDIANFYDKIKNIENYYYISDVMVDENHRRQGIAQLLFTEAIKNAKALEYKFISLAYESHKEHPLKPVDYYQLEYLWRKLGFSKTDTKLDWSWLTFQEDGRTSIPAEHKLDFWAQEL